jgi:peptidoglycan-N-acetylglucosamine deacetylase
MSNFNQQPDRPTAPQPHESSLPEELPLEVAVLVFGEEAVKNGDITVECDTKEAAEQLAKKIREAKEQVAERRAREAEQARQQAAAEAAAEAAERAAAEAAAEAAERAAAEAEYDQQTRRGRRVGAFALATLLVGVVSASVLGATGAGASLYDDIFNKKQASATANVPNPSSSPTASAPTSEAPKPSPSATETAPVSGLVAAKDLASIQTPQPQPFKNEYPVAANGDIKGYVGYYEAGTTPEEVQWMESCGNTTEKVQLAFDDGGNEAHTRKIAALLTEMNVGAVFFINTYNTSKDGHQPLSQDLVNDLRNAGFFVANHSSTHPDMTKMSDEEIRQEIIAGGPANLIRLPYGATYLDENNNIYIDDRVVEVAKSTGAAVCMWSVDALDWEKGATVESILQNVERDVAPGANVLFHDNPNNPTLEALPQVVEAIKGKGLQLCPPSKKPTTADFSEVKICSSSSQ